MSENKKFLEKLLKDRYYQPKETSWHDVCKRVARFVSGSDADKYNRYFDMMDKRLFCPASPMVMSAGTKKPMLSSCFGLPLEDNMENILTTVRNTGLVTCAGGGVGFDFTPIRPEGSMINSLSKCAALGPVGVLKMINGMVNELKQSGRRKGACHGSIDVRHPDMLKFIESKYVDGKISNFNLSVFVDDEFMEKATAEFDYDYDQDEVNLFNKICEHACRNGNPGILYGDTINRDSPFWEKHGIKITTVNTCSEIPGPNNFNCLLGSINLSKFVYYDTHLDRRIFDITNFEKIVLDSLEFLNDCLDINELPLKQLQDFSDKYRQIGLGCTGFHDLLIKLGTKYGSSDSYELAHLIGQMMEDLADSTRDKYKNITSLTMAPTGSVSLLLETGSFSIEPLLFREMDRHYVDNDGTAHTFKIVHPLWEDRKNLKLDDSLFQDSMDIDPMVHLKMVSIFQKYIDNSISKTIMLPAGSTPADVKKIFVEAWKLGLKGITVYVNESKLEQVYSSSEPTKGGKGKTEENQVPETKKRPKFLQGKTYKCRNSNGSFYITLNEHDGTAFEIFSTPNVNMSADSARSHEAVVNTEALTRVISLCLRSGVNPQSISQQLERVRSQSLLSLPIQIANILSMSGAGKPTQKALPVMAKRCPSCQGPGLVYDGCWTCIKCGWSKCD